MSVLEQLYYGNICPNDRIIKKGSEYGRLGDRISRYEGELTTMLDVQGKELYDKIICMRGTQESIAEREIFIDGFRLGAQIMLEVVTRTEKQLAPLDSLP